jgi:hypothetical protein
VVVVPRPLVLSISSELTGPDEPNEESSGGWCWRRCHSYLLEGGVPLTEEERHGDRGTSRQRNRRQGEPVPTRTKSSDHFF